MIQRGEEPAIGVLIDWDHSVNPSEPNDLFGPAVVDVSTTAIDLLLGRPWSHLYRYQLESFFYILIWATIHYDLEQMKTLGSAHPALGGWVLRDMRTLLPKMLL
ncbi:hypothetical protein FA13DRAFT_1750716 [Coprinellus micaceus]|uniref:Fungal-type protein kinase domain-containing protein n=1 Tax=Coprinellus micaceus TaxID=71717 RepID=A0A4Y7R596_COPMI|nr:hypothetical protein FA13DRAFT_1750716 [Coprinellus micaceus]